MQSIFMIAKRMRNTTGSGRWMDTNGEAPTWGVLIVFVFVYLYFPNPSSLVAQRLKRLPAMWETRVQSLVWEDPLEKEIETHSSTLAWRIPWTEEPGRLPGVAKSRTRLTNSLYYILEKRWCHLEQIIRDSAHTLKRCWKGKEKGLNLDKDLVILTPGI